MLALLNMGTAVNQPMTNHSPGSNAPLAPPVVPQMLWEKKAAPTCRFVSLHGTWRSYLLKKHWQKKTSAKHDRGFQVLHHLLVLLCCRCYFYYCYCYKRLITMTLNDKWWWLLLVVWCDHWISILVPRCIPKTMRCKKSRKHDSTPQSKSCCIILHRRPRWGRIATNSQSQGPQVWWFVGGPVR